MMARRGQILGWMVASALVGMPLASGADVALVLVGGPPGPEPAATGKTPGLIDHERAAGEVNPGPASVPPALFLSEAVSIAWIGAVAGVGLAGLGIRHLRHKGARAWWTSARTLPPVVPVPAAAAPALTVRASTEPGVDDFWTGVQLLRAGADAAGVQSLDRAVRADCTHLLRFLQDADFEDVRRKAAVARYLYAYKRELEDGTAKAYA